MNMKKKWEKIKSQIFKVIITINSHHTGAYAAQAAYFFVLSLIPIFLLLLTMVRFTPITMSEVMTAVLKVFPESVAPMIRSIVSQVYFQSGTIVPVTIVVALWSAGKGVLSVTSGLNSICENMETRNYFYLRIRASRRSLQAAGMEPSGLNSQGRAGMRILYGPTAAFMP